MLNKGEILCFGELLWNQQTTQKLPAGGPMNIGFHLTQLGYNVAIASNVDDDRMGDELLNFLEERGVKTELVQRHPVNPDHRLEVKFEGKKNAPIHSA